jgi:hypothetical protein
MNSIYIKKNITTISFILLVICVYVVYELKPNFIYNIDGSFKKFGVGNNSKTIIPIWGLILILAILIYTGIRFLIILPKL